MDSIARIDASACDSCDGASLLTCVRCGALRLRYRERQNTCCLAALSVNTRRKKHTVIWTSRGLPADAYRVLAAPRGGALVLSQCLISYHSQARIRRPSMTVRRALLFLFDYTFCAPLSLRACATRSAHAHWSQPQAQCLATSHHGWATSTQRPPRATHSSMPPTCTQRRHPSWPRRVDRGPTAP